MILLDTNVILRSKQKNADDHSSITKKLVQFTEQGELLIVAPQIIYEFYAIITRPIEQGGLGLSSTIGFKEVESILDTYTILPENGALLAYWQNLVKKFDLKGSQTHDARLVAYMQAHGITKLFTLNLEDFRKYKKIIEVLS